MNNVVPVDCGVVALAVGSELAASAAIACEKSLVSADGGPASDPGNGNWDPGGTRPGANEVEAMAEALCSASNCASVVGVHSSACETICVGENCG